MALNKQVVPVVLSSGIDTKSDIKNTLPGKLLTLENGTFVSRSRIRKRPGRQQVLALPSNVGQMLASYSGELLAGDGLSLYSRGTDGSANLRGNLLSAVVTRQPVQRTSTSPAAPDIAFDPTTQRRFHAWQDGPAVASISYAVFDSGGLALVTPRVLNSGFSRPKCVALGAYFLVFSRNGHVLNLRSVPAATLSGLGSADISSDFSSLLPAYDACIANGFAWVAYNSTAAGTLLIAVGPDLSVHGPYAVGSQRAAAVGCSPSSDGSQVLVAWSDGFVVRRQAMTAAIPSVQVGGPVAVEAVSNVKSVAVAPDGRTYYTVSGSAANPTADPSNSYPYFVRTSPAAAAPVDLARSVALAGKVLWDGTSSYAPLAFQTPLQDTYFLARQDGYLAAKWLPGLGGGIPSDQFLPAFVLASGTKFVTTALEQVEAQSANANVTPILGVDAVFVDLFDPQASYQRDVLADGIHFGGGVLQEYDGTTLCEHGFHVFPENIVLTSAPLGGAISSGSHGYQATYEWLDGQGRLHHSAPSPVIQASNDPAHNPAIEVQTTGSTGTLGDLPFNASTSPGSTVLATSPASAELLFPGCLLAGPVGQTFPGTFVETVNAGDVGISCYQAPPAAGTRYAAQYRLSTAASVAAQGEVWQVGNITEVPFFGVPTAGSAVLPVFSVLGLVPGQAVRNVNGRLVGGTTILSVDPTGHTVTLSAPASTTSKQPVCFFAAAATNLARLVQPGMGVVDIGAPGTGTITLSGVALNDSFTLNAVPFRATTTTVKYSELDAAPFFSNVGGDGAAAASLADQLDNPYYGGTLNIFTNLTAGDTVTLLDTVFQAAGSSDGGTSFAITGNATGTLANLMAAITATLGLRGVQAFVHPFSAAVGAVVSVSASLLSFSGTATGSIKIYPGGALRLYDAGVLATVVGSVISVQSRQFGSSGDLAWTTSTSSIALSDPTSLQGGADPVLLGVARVVSTDNSSHVTLDQRALSSASFNRLFFQDLFAVRADVPQLRLTNKPPTFQAKVYRTPADVGPPLFLAGTAASQGPDFLSILDGLSDKSLVGQLQLYTAGGVLENESAPPCGSVVVFKNRLVVLDSEFPTQLWFSKAVVPGLPAEFSPFQVINLDPRGGPGTALAVLDDKLIVFKRSSVFYISGDGPDATGNNNDFSEPQLVSTDVGCSVPRSAVLVRDGILFQSDKGWYLLNRGLAATYIGMDAEGFNGQPATSARLDANHNRVYCTLSGGPALVYDYQFDQWDTFTPLLAADSAVYQGNFTFLGPDGVAWQETPGAFLDSVQPIKLRLVTGWMALSGLQGFQRVYKLNILGEFDGPHILLVKIGYDYEDEWSQQVVIDCRTAFNAQSFGQQSVFGGSQLVGIPMASLPMGVGPMAGSQFSNPVPTDDQQFGGPPQVYQHRVFTSRQKCQAIRFGIEDLQVVAGANEGFNISAITLEVAGLGGIFRLGAGRSFG